MLKIVPLEESKGGDKETTASSKEAVRREGIENSSPQGKKRTASEDPETVVSKRGKKSSLEGPVTGDVPAVLCPQGDQPSTELYVKGCLIIREILASLLRKITKKFTL